MAMPSKNKQHNFPPPLFLSLNCSSFKSIYRSCRRHFSCSDPCHSLPADPITRKSSSTPLLEKPPSRKFVYEGHEAARTIYWERAQQLEHEIGELDKWLNNEKKLRESLNNFTAGTHSYSFDDLKVVQRSTKYCGRTDQWPMRLADGGYLYGIITGAMGRPCGTLAMQVSAPAIVPMEIGSSISQILNRMASMGQENLINWLSSSMPMCDIRTMEINSSPVAPWSKRGLSEAIFIKTVKNIETLALEGLKIQLGCQEKVKKNEKAQKKIVDGRAGSACKECLVEVMLIQVRDTSKGYEAVGGLMIALVEAIVAEEEQESGFLVEGIRLAGISAESDQTRRGGYLWSICTSRGENCSSSRKSERPEINFDIRLFA